MPQEQYVESKGHIIGEQQEVMLDDGIFILEWDGDFWIKKYKMCEVTKWVGDPFNGGEFKTILERHHIWTEEEERERRIR